jgi:hypothetical protein
LFPSSSSFTNTYFLSQRREKKDGRGSKRNLFLSFARVREGWGEKGRKGLRRENQDVEERKQVKEKEKEKKKEKKREDNIDKEEDGDGESKSSSSFLPHLLHSSSPIPPPLYDSPIPHHILFLFSPSTTLIQHLLGYVLEFNRSGAILQKKFSFSFFNKLLFLYSLFLMIFSISSSTS